MTILVDYENVTNHNGLKGLEYVNDKDILIIFYSAACKSIRKGDVTLIEQSGCKWSTYKLQAPGKNALDFYIFYCIEKGTGPLQKPYNFPTRI